MVLKQVKKVVLSAFIDHAEHNKLSPERQSANRRHHSTESAVVSVMNDIIRLIDDDEVVALVMLHLSTVFDMVDHRT